MSSSGDRGPRSQHTPSGSDPFGLRPATLADVPAMCATIAEGLASYRAWAPDWTPPADVTDPAVIGERFGAPGFTAHVNADVTAHVATYPAADEPGAVHLFNLFARPHRQGTGVAAALLSLAVADARASGATVMRLRTPTGNLRGIAFYRREGWAQHGPPLSGSEPGTGLGLEHVWMRRPL